jgi:hypothetical protein
MIKTPGLHSSNGNQYALLDFNQVTEKGLKPFIDALGKAGLTVENVDASNRPTNSNGIKVKTAVLRFQDQQEVKIAVNDSGDLASFKLNGRSIPVQHADTLAKVADSLSTIVKQNSQKFTDGLARKAKRVIDTSDNRAAVKSNVQRLKEARDRRDQLATSTKAISDEVAKYTAQSSNIQQRIAAAQTRYATAQALTAQLQDKIKTMESQNAA